MLGSGSFGVVYTGFDVKHRVPVAIKLESARFHDLSITFYVLSIVFCKIFSTFQVPLDDYCPQQRCKALMAEKSKE